jgi:hypothetical protein
MSTKNLARTVIEGGRARYNKWARRHSHAQERFQERMVSSRLLSAIELAGDFVYAKRENVGRDFDDKLRPAERWLGSQVGRPWNKVRSELFARFDLRTTAGRHIVFCHLLPSVDLEIPRPGSRADFTVDAHGILRRKRRTLRVPKPKPWLEQWTVPLPEAREVLDDWLAGRRVGERSPHLYWFVPTPTGSFRQHLRLTDAEAARWRSLPRWFRDLNDAFNRSSLERS